MTDKPDLVSRATLEAVAENFTALSALRDRQRSTMARMLKLCILRLESPDSRKRREGINALRELHALLEKSA